jgi:hypothetical protein
MYACLSERELIPGFFGCISSFCKSTHLLHRVGSSKSFAFLVWGTSCCSWAGSVNIST